MRDFEQLQTIHLSFQEICEGADPWIPLGNFMNDFFGNFPDQREELVKEPIAMPATKTPEHYQWAVFCAASVEYLCQKYQINCPEWVFSSAYEKLSEPWYHSPGAHKERVRERLQAQSPEPFARRNIFCSNRVFANKYELAAEMRQRQSA